MKGYAMLKIGESAGLKKTVRHAVRWMRSVNHSL